MNAGNHTQAPRKSNISGPWKKDCVFSNIRMCAGLDSEILIPPDDPDNLKPGAAPPALRHSLQGSLSPGWNIHFEPVGAVVVRPSQRDALTPVFPNRRYSIVLNFPYLLTRISMTRAARLSEKIKA
jgi:hypothetical protein